MEDFARRLNSDWPERMQEILSLGQESRPVNGNGSLRRYASMLTFPSLLKVSPCSSAAEDVLFA